MKIIDVSQGSKEWLDMRREKITATDCAAILGKSRYRSPRMVWMSKMSDVKNYVNAAMERGKRLEPIARSYFESKYETGFFPYVVVSEERPWQMASLDGYDEHNHTILEIKCVGESVFRRAQEGEIAQDYIWQCYHQLAVCEQAERVLLAFYFQDGGVVETIEICISRDEEKIAELNEKEYQFYHHNILGFHEPAMTDMDVETKDDEIWLKAASEWVSVKKCIEEHEKMEQDLREILIRMSSGVSCRGGGVQVTKYIRRGNVDYARIPQLKDINLDAYRKESTEAWRLTEF